MAGTVSRKDVETAGYVRFMPTAIAALRNLSGNIQDSIIATLDDLRVPTDSNDLDEGMWRPKASSDVYYYFRRGLTRARRRELDEASRTNVDYDREVTAGNPWDYFIFYRETTTSECIRFMCPRGITVMDIRQAQDVFGGLRGKFPNVLNRY